MTEFKAHCQYLHEYLITSERCDRNINLVLAIASSSSIGGWALWKEFSFIWAVIIASSQVLNVIKPYIPFNKRIKPLRALSYDYNGLMIKLESDWFHIAQGNLTEEDIHNKIIDFKKKKSQLWEKNMSEITLPHNKKLHSQSIEIAESYFHNNY